MYRQSPITIAPFVLTGCNPANTIGIFQCKTGTVVFRIRRGVSSVFSDTNTRCREVNPSAPRRFRRISSAMA